MMRMASTVSALKGSMIPTAIHKWMSVPAIHVYMGPAGMTLMAIGVTVSLDGWVRTVT